MNLNSLALGALALSLPIVIEVRTTSDGHGSDTHVSVIGGTGSYAIIDRGCEGQVIDKHPVGYHDAGGEIEHRFSNGMAVGLRAGTLDERVKTRLTITNYATYPYRDSVVVLTDQSTNSYLNPTVGFEGNSFGIGGGWISARRQFEVGGHTARIDPSFHLRVGSLDGRYARIAFMENVPLLSGGGYFNIGIGAHPHRLWDLYVGISSVPFDAMGAVLKVDYRVLDHWALNGRARLGGSEGESECGVAIGLTYASQPPHPPIVWPR